MTVRYTFADWKFGKPLPENWKGSKAVLGSGWLMDEIDAFVLAMLPGKATANTQAVWSNRDMRDCGWRVLPYGWGYEVDGSAVLFDREYRPICRIGKDGAVKMVDVNNDDWRTSGKIFLYNDGSKPRDCKETRRLVISIVERLGLAGELLRRAVLERNGVLRKSEKWGRDYPWTPMGRQCVERLARAIGGKGVFAFDMSSGEVLRIRPPSGAGGRFEPRPMNDADITGAVSWLRGEGVEGRPDKKGAAAIISVVAALRPCLYLPG